MPSCPYLCCSIADVRLKQLVAILIALGVLLQVSSKLVILMNYYTHKDYIAAHLCENRDKPKMKCCGKCYLRKQLNKDERNDKQRTEKNETVVTLFCQQTPSFKLSQQYFFIDKAFTIRYTNDYRYNHLVRIFHPPTVA